MSDSDITLCTIMQRKNWKLVSDNDITLCIIENEKTGNQWVTITTLCVIEQKNWKLVSHKNKILYTIEKKKLETSELQWHNTMHNKTKKLEIDES